MNAKIGSGHHDYSECIGRYDKGKMNSNGKYLAEFALLNDFFLRNIKFKHKMCHRTTWTGPGRRIEFEDKNGEIRRNPFRNQINYILIKRRDSPFERNSCSYGGIGLNKDHKFVKAEPQIEWLKMKINKKKEDINIDNFKDSRNPVKYQEKIQERLEEKEGSQAPG